MGGTRRDGRAFRFRARATVNSQNLVEKVESWIDPSTRNLWDNITRLKLDVQTVLPIHGRMVKVDELRLEAGVE